MEFGTRWSKILNSKDVVFDETTYYKDCVRNKEKPQDNSLRDEVEFEVELEQEPADRLETSEQLTSQEPS